MPEPTTIERQWLEFADNFPGLAENDEAKRMFYSGAIAIVATTFRVANENPSAVPALFNRLRREIDDYFEAARRENAMKARRIVVPN